MHCIQYGIYEQASCIVYMHSISTSKLQLTWPGLVGPIVGLFEGGDVGAAVIGTVGDFVGGAAVGATLGALVGCTVGPPPVGSAVGTSVGNLVGASVGPVLVGLFVGRDVGSALGWSVGSCGYDVGLLVGAWV
jgi:hypothetical protein